MTEEKNNLIQADSKYLDIEKDVDKNLKTAVETLAQEQNKLEKFSINILDTNHNLEISNFLNQLNINLLEIKNFINNNKIQDATYALDNMTKKIKDKIALLEVDIDKNMSGEIIEMNASIKKHQEDYAISFSKSQEIKTDSTKRKERLSNIDKEIQNWDRFKINSEKMSTDLIKRLETIENEIELTSKLPEKIAIQKGQLIQSEIDTKSSFSEISEKLVSSENEYNKINNHIRSVQERMMSAREKRARSIATLEGSKLRKKDLVERVTDDLDVNEENLFKFSDLNDIDNLPDALEQEEKLDKKKRQREALGSVNLRADEESKEFVQNINKMEKDREDLVSAIIKLRAGINELNQKGRERLLEAYEKVNNKFNEVYKKLFNGGNAKLELVDSEDPLEAGLEMLVSPPGKRLQSITLLSGGEQALTALALIFAVFLTSPAPICVLDEVDAPLDDANVTRFCSLLDELTKITSTKFIIITHHAFTMSRMNRLYGVTMPEKGISQLVAVNLEKAEELVA